MQLIKKTILLALLVTTQLHARNDILTLPFDEALQYGYQQGVLNESIQFFLAGTQHPSVIKSHDEFRSNKKTNAFGKSDEEACKWVLLSALKSFQARAISLGANAVVNIKSNYKNREYTDSKNYQCGAGAIMAGVALKGEVVKL